jgi:hypothetical protein
MKSINLLLVTFLSGVVLLIVQCEKEDELVAKINVAHKGIHRFNLRESGVGNYRAVTTDFDQNIDEVAFSLLDKLPANRERNPCFFSSDTTVIDSIAQSDTTSNVDDVHQVIVNDTNQPNNENPLLCVEYERYYYTEPVRVQVFKPCELKVYKK